MLTFPTISVLAAISPVGIFRAELLRAATVNGLRPTPAFLGEEGNRVPDCVFFCHVKP